MNEDVEKRLELIERMIIERFRDQFRALGAFWIIGGVLATLATIAAGDDWMGQNPVVGIVLSIIIGGLIISMGILIWTRRVWAIYVGLLLNYSALLTACLDAGNSEPAGIVILIVMTLKGHHVIGWIGDMRDVDLQYDKPQDISNRSNQL